MAGIVGASSWTPGKGQSFTDTEDLRLGDFGGISGFGSSSSSQKRVWREEMVW